MQIIFDLHIPVSLAQMKHSILPGTKGTLNTVTVQISLLLLVSRRQSSIQQLASSPTHVKITNYIFYHNSLHVLLQA